MAEELKFIASVQDNATEPLKKIGTGLKVLSTEAEKSTESFKKTGNIFSSTLPQSIAKTTAAATTLPPVLKSVATETTKVNTGFKATGTALQSVAPALSNVSSELGSVVSGFLEAGIAGFAVAAVGVGIKLLGDYFNEAARAAEESARATAAAKKEYEGIVTTVAKEASTVAVLVESFKKENLSRNEKISIIKQLQQISPAYFGNLDIEKTTVEQLTSAYDSYSRAVIRSIELKIREGQLNKIIEQRLALQDKGVKKTNVEIDANGKIIKSVNAIFDAESNGRKTQFNDLLLTQAEQTKLNNLLLTEKELLAQIANIKQPQDFKTFDPLKEAAKKSVVHKKTISDVLAELGREIDFLNAKKIAFGINVNPEKIREITNTIEKLIKDFRVAPDDTIIRKLFGDIETLRPLVIEAIDKIVSTAKERLVSNPIIAPIKPVIVLGDIEGIKNEYFLKGQELSDALVKGIEDGLEATLENIAINFGEMIGNAITGKADIGDFFDGMFKQIGAGLKQLGTYFIKTAIQIKLFKEFATKYPLLAIAAGVALVALGTVINNATAKKQAFAHGGLVGGTGNRDTVNALLTPGEFVITKSAVQKIGIENLQALNGGGVVQSVGAGVTAGTQQINGTLEAVIDGKLIRLVLNRADASLSRTG